ncbi:uncharacterized protein LOC129234234 [Uloborus diversus]|uniref:uncharacterized protein LOC129234234 n=1 Tax=Uloborus diversus TaxID=327109 RepID=UPI0024094FEE|nr:uncharacterized protein LOC129234234 [Uloborus diversus]
MKKEYERDCKEEENDEAHKDTAERKIDYESEVQSYPQMKALKVENRIATGGVDGVVSIRHWSLERQAAEREISTKTELERNCKEEEYGEVHKDAAERKIAYESEVQSYPQIKALKVENRIAIGGVDGIVSIRHWPLERKAAEQEISMKKEYERDCKEEENDEAQKDAAGRKIDYESEVQCYPQMKALKVENSIATCGNDGIVNVRHLPLDRLAAEREISTKMNAVEIKPKRVSWKIKLEKWFKRMKNRLTKRDGVPYKELS